MGLCSPYASSTCIAAEATSYRAEPSSSIACGVAGKISAFIVSSVFPTSYSNKILHFLFIADNLMLMK
jgi:hypothetical protein